MTFYDCPSTAGPLPYYASFSVSVATRGWLSLGADTDCDSLKKRFWLSKISATPIKMDESAMLKMGKPLLYEPPMRGQDLGKYPTYSGTKSMSMTWP